MSVITDILSVRARKTILARILLLNSRERLTKTDHNKNSNIIKLEYKQKNIFKDYGKDYWY